MYLKPYSHYEIKTQKSISAIKFNADKKITVFQNGGNLTANATFPIKGDAIRLSCVQNSNSSQAIWYNPRLQDMSLAGCRLDLWMCIPPWIGTAGQPSYMIGVSDIAAFVEILSLNRTRDQAVWRCTDLNEWFDDRLNLTVYSEFFSDIDHRDIAFYCFVSSYLPLESYIIF
ncbi:hypothetical protein CHS0354_006374 [Potamilus streckersoni]|uniref:Uncharacterized protein n=1 Tax=Potamilus streckersoni TaxID=2493646 RepID=A0AAE0VVG2_9BIVA|nr:hypothetical protein CHS0354_006374 [Potamilus streckersoni]